MNLEELEDELSIVILDVAATARGGTDEELAQVMQFGRYYMPEVVKRWRTKDITREHVRRLARKAVMKRLREEGAQHLKELISHAQPEPLEPAKEAWTSQIVNDPPAPTEEAARRADPDQEVVSGQEVAVGQAFERPVPRPPRGPKLTYTLCRKCGRALGNLEPGAEPVWVDSCAFPGCK